MHQPLRAPFWTTRTPGQEGEENRAAVFLYGRYSIALMETRYADARAIMAEMTPTKIKEF